MTTKYGKPLVLHLPAPLIELIDGLADQETISRSAWLRRTIATAAAQQAPKAA